MNHQHRLQQLRERMASDGLEGLIVSSAPNVRYLTGFTGEGQVAVTPGQVLLSTDGSVALSERLSGELSDELSYGDVEQVSGTGANDSWLTPEIPESEGGGVLEPIIVTGVIASLIYLFYSSRAE